MQDRGVSGEGLDGRRGLRGSLWWCLVLSAGLSSPGAAQTPLQLADDFPTLSNVYAIADQRADFIVAVDRSRSMNAIWPEVKEQLLLFVSALPDHDFLSVIGFAEDADHLVLPRTISPESRTALLGELRQLSSPRDQPRERGQRTDLVAGADLALETVNRPGAAGITFVFILTDFLHDPPRGAPPKAAAIQQLAEKYSNYVQKTGRLVKAYAIQLPLEPGAGEDFDIASATFGGRLSRVMATRNSLAEWFEQVRVSFGREKLKVLVEADLEAPITFGASTLNATADVTWTNRSRLAAVVERFELRLLEATFTAGDAVPLASRDAGIFAAQHTAFPSTRYLALRQCRVVQASATYGLRFEAGTELAQLNLSSESAGRFDDAGVEACAGTPASVHAAILVVVGAALFVAWRYWVRKKHAFDGRKVRVGLSVAGRQVGGELSFAPDAAGVLSVVLPELSDRLGAELGRVAERLQRVVTLPPLTLRFVGARPRFPSKRPARGTYAWVDDGQSGSGAALRGTYVIKSFAEYADPESVGRPLALTPDFDGEPFPEFEDLHVRIRYTAPGQPALDFELRLSPDR